MLWRFFQRDDLTPRAVEFRRVHEAWLTRALSSPRAVPRIPVRRHDDGGFGPLLKRPTGRSHAERWWSLAFDRVDEV